MVNLIKIIKNTFKRESNKKIFDKRRVVILGIGFILLISLLTYAGILLYRAKTTKAAWFDDNWAYRQKSAITNAGSNQTDFQVQITMNTSTLVTAGKMQSDCDDIRITAYNGQELPYWIEPTTCNGASTKIWTKVPSIPTSGANVYIYYGNPSASGKSATLPTFIQDLAEVHGAWNLDETSGTRADSSGDGNTLTDNATVTSNPGQYGNAAQFTAANAESLSRTDNASLSTGNINFTITQWVYLDNKTTERTFLTREENGAGFTEYRTQYHNGQDRFLMFLFDSSGTLIANAQANAFGSPSTGTWYFIATWNDADKKTAYIQINNGAINSGGYSSSVSDSAADTVIGEYGLGGGDMDGRVDEVRFYKRLLTNQERTDLYNTSNLGYFTSNYANHELLRKYTTTAPSAGTPSGEEKGTGPVGYWRFDEGYGTPTNDATVNNGDGTISGATWKTEDLCASGKCLFFDGTDDIVTITENSGIDLGGTSDSYSVSAWIRTSADVAGGTRATIFSKDDGTGAHPYKLRLNDTEKMCFRIGDGTNQPDACGTNALNDGKWHHIVGIRDVPNDRIDLYIDGVQAATTPDTTTATTANNDNVFIGAENTGTVAGEFTGHIDEVKIYNYARTAAQIKADFAARGTNEGVSASFTPDQKFTSDGLVGYWKLDEASTGAGAVSRTDSSGNGNTLTDNNTTPSNAGKFSNAIDPSGSSEYLSITDNAILSTGDISFTITAWVYADALGTEYAAVNKTTAQDTNREFLLRKNGASNDFGFGFFEAVGGAAKEVISTNFGAISTSTWYFVVGSYDSENDTLGISVNAGPPNTLTGVTGPADTTGGFYIGSEAGGHPWNGRIDDVRFYKRLLTNQEKEKLYNWAPGPVVHLKFDENTGTSSTNDSSGYGYTGTMNSFESTDWVPGKFGSALEFDGVNEYVNNTSFSQDVDTFSVAWWLYPRTCTDFNETVLINGWNQFNFHSEVGCGVYTGTDVATRFTPTDLPDGTLTLNTWQHFEFTFNAGSAKLYKNGTVIASKTGMTNPTAFTLYQVGSGAAGTINGYADDFRIYTYERTAKQVIEDMDAGHPAGGSPISSMVGYWNLDEQQGQTVYDKGFGDNDGTRGANSGSSTDDPTWKIAGSSSCKINGCLDLDGGDFVNIPDSADLRPENGSWTVTAWAKPPDSNQSTAIFGKRQNSGDFEMVLFGVCGDIEFTSGQGLCAWFRQSGTVERRAYASTDVADGNWHHYTMVADKNYNNIRLYFDGKEVATTLVTDSSWPTVNNTDAAQIGKANDGFFFTGPIDEVKVYNDALTASQILIDMNAGSAAAMGGVLGTQNNEEFGSLTPAGWWKMDENTGNSTTVDSSGNEKTMTMTSMETTDWTPGKMGSALDFDGSAEYLINSSVILAISNFTITAWIKPDTAGGYTVYMEGTTVANNPYFQFSYNGASAGVMTFGSRNDANTEQDGSLASTGGAVVGQWNFVAMSKDSSGNIVFYVNGVKSIATVATAGTYNNMVHSVIGQLHRNTDAQFFDGQIDDVRVFSSVLTDAQVAYIYNRGAPLAHYKFDECQGATAYNSAPTGSGAAAGNNGTITPGASGNLTAGTCGSGTGTEMWNDGTTGKRNASLGFDGIDDYVTVADNAALRPENGSWSVAVWGKPDNSSTFQVLVAKRQNSGDFESYSLAIHDSGQRLSAYLQQNASNVRVAESIEDVTDGNWHHYVMVADQTADKIKLYMDGRELSATTSLSAGSWPTVNNTDALRIGEGNGLGPLLGQIDEVMIYNYALSASQAKQIYNNGAIFFGPATGSP